MTVILPSTMDLILRPTEDPGVFTLDFRERYTPGELSAEDVKKTVDAVQSMIPPEHFKVVSFDDDGMGFTVQFSGSRGMLASIIVSEFIGHTQLAGMRLVDLFTGGFAAAAQANVALRETAKGLEELTVMLGGEPPAAAD